MCDDLLAEDFQQSGCFHCVCGYQPQADTCGADTGKALFIGDCAINTTGNLRYALGDRAICVDGCPPIASVHRELDKLREENGKEKL
jgi:hypothetical protein